MADLSLIKFDDKSNKAKTTPDRDIMNRHYWELKKGQRVNTFAGDDKIIGGHGFSYTGGIYNKGTIKMGPGDDTIEGRGNNDDGIDNHGNISTDTGDDIIYGKADSSYGIDNYSGTIYTGDGDDLIIGKGSSNYYGIYNGGTINTGLGNDIVNALWGGLGSRKTIHYGTRTPITSRGTIKLGPGDDIVASSRAKYSGFGGTLLGGPGKDTIILGKGKWTISGKIITEGNSGVPTAFSGDMFHVKDFEQIGGNSGDLFTFRDGTLTVDSRGVGTFA